jgi:hypothetical protein
MRTKETMKTKFLKTGQRVCLTTDTCMDFDSKYELHVHH